MKKSTINALIAIVASASIENKDEILNDLYNEINNREKAYQSRKRKVTNERAMLVKTIIPVVLEYLPRVEDKAMTAKELFNMCENELPEDYTLNKLQYLLLNDIEDIRKVSVKGKPFMYYLG